MSGKADLINCTICSNTAKRGSTDSTAALNVESGRVWLGSGTRFANNSFSVKAAEVIYVLPAPPGHYINARKCEVVYTPCPSNAGDCPDGCTQNKSLIPGATSNDCTQRPYYIQSCPWNMHLVANGFGEEILGLVLETLLPGDYNLAEWPVPCSPGLLGATADNIDDQTTPLCAGLCPAGFYCPARTQRLNRDHVRQATTVQRALALRCLAQRARTLMQPTLPATASARLPTRATLRQRAAPGRPSAALALLLPTPA